MHAFDVQTDKIPRYLAEEILFSDVPFGHWYSLPSKIREAQCHGFQYTRIYVH